MAAEKKPPSLAKIALAGGWAGSMEILVTYPLEFAKTHLQLQHGAAGTKSGFDRGVLHCLASTVKRSCNTPEQKRQMFCPPQALTLWTHAGTSNA